jgi:hypothetical protein
VGGNPIHGPVIGEVILVGLRDAGEIDRAIAAFARRSNGGLIVTGSAPAAVHRELIIASAARHRLPAVYPYPLFASSGGLISYGPDTLDQYRRAASYVDLSRTAEFVIDGAIRDSGAALIERPTASRVAMQ